MDGPPSSNSMQTISYITMGALEEEEYIDMDLSSSPILLPCNPKPFRFQYYPSNVERDPTPSPADELFYTGLLLPLHVPPRLQMVEKLLNNDHTPTIAAAAATITIHDPVETTCEVGEKVEALAKKSWASKLKVIKEATLNLKLKASKAYVKSPFAKHPSSSSSSSASSSCSSSFLLGGIGNPIFLRRSNSLKSEAECSIQGAIAHCKNSLQKVSARKSLGDVGYY